MKKSILITLIAFLTVLNCKSQNLTDTKKIIHDLDSIRAHYKIPAVNFGVATCDSIILVGALGVRDINTNAPVTVNDLFHIASLGKGFTSFIAGKLVDEGKISWDTRFFELFPELKQSSRKEYHNLDLKSLLSHRTHLKSLNDSGVQALIDRYKSLFPDDRFSNYTFAIYGLSLEPVKYDLDQFYHYTSMGYVLASLMLEKASGLTYARLVDKTNEDLGVHFNIGWPQDVSEDQPSGHLIPAERGFGGSNELQVVNGDMFTGWAEDWLYYCIPSGHHSVSVFDFLKYLQLNLNGLSGRDNYLKASTYDFIFNGANEYAMGWGNDIMENGNYYYGHTGTAGNYFAKAIILKESGIAIAIMANAGNGRTKGELLPFEKYLTDTFSFANSCGQSR